MLVDKEISQLWSSSVTYNAMSDIKVRLSTVVWTGTCCSLYWDQSALFFRWPLTNSWSPPKETSNFDTGGPEAWRTREQHEVKRRAISCSTASVWVMSFLAVLIMPSPFTMDITCYSHFSFGRRAWLNLTWPRGLTKQMVSAWIYTPWLWKKGARKIFISSQGSAKVTTTACLCSDMKPISVMELSKCHKKQRGAMEHPFPRAFLGWWVF